MELIYEICFENDIWNIKIKREFINRPCNSIFELCRTLVIHCIYIMWMLTKKLHELQSYHSPYIQCNSLQFYQNNLFSTIMQLHYKCTHDIMLALLIVIHLLKSNTCHYELFFDIPIIFFLKNWFPSSITIINDGPKLSHMAKF
jgi:hypothetical protein